jgi:nucleotide-binding universal stress UspA family protein
MKKILLSFDGNHFSPAAFEFARNMNAHEPILLTGVFLPPADFTGAQSYAYVGSAAYLIPLVENRDPELTQESINKFEDQCLQNGIEFRVHQDASAYALQELKKESRFADLMIIGSEKFYENLGLETPNEYLKDALHNTECPVIVTPENVEFPESIVLAYDGSKSSVYAIRSFVALFPRLCHKRAILLYAEQKPGEGIPHEKLIRELAANYFSDISFHEMDADPKKYLNTWLGEIEKPILVSGAYGRSGLSQIFRQSFIKNVMEQHSVPVFIAHS